jgi:prepilin-type N-terminal cleavage/methylation domain-containing protein/prepilin-type processing-associated H-X9-DG protein
MWRLKYQSNDDGFTLIEVFIVIFVILILAGILFPVLSRARESGRKTQCASNLRTIGLGLTMYSNENNETFPTGAILAMTDLNALYPDYVSERKAFMCLSDNLVTSATNASITANDPFEKDECSYGYDNTHSQSNDPGVAIAADRPSNTAGNVPQDANSPNHGGTVNAIGTADIPGYGQNVVYIDGHVEWVASPTAGWADANGNRDNIYTGSGSGTDTYVLQDSLSEEDMALLALIDDPSISSSDLKTALNDALPVSDTVLNEAINRSDPMNSGDLKNVLVNASPLTTSLLQSVVDRSPSMSSGDNKDVLIASSPLPTSILNQVIAGNPQMIFFHRWAVLNAQ